MEQANSRLPRLIPAHAGKTTHSQFQVRPPPAHPRSRGENIAWLVDLFNCSGSSPLTRGKQGGAGFGGDESGLIPAHAGKTQDVVGVHAAPWAHPRSRGENNSTTGVCSPSDGSSPLTRGKHGLFLIPRDLERLIPAHAGKTPSRSSARPGNAAHPRSRGENDFGRKHPVSVKGSSPLTRGKPVPGARGGAEAGLIPAHAGKTHARPARSLRPSAHPRSRGENAAHPDEVMNALGSSPLTRGKPAIW